jgi:prepilin-type N-terminal cleavage/methylation domain-containing protein
MPSRVPRAGFTLIELVVTVAIFSIVAGIGAYAGQGALPRWQTRSMAYRVKADLERCRAIAITYGSYCRVKLLTYDNALGTSSVSKGSYAIQWCNTKGGDAYEDGTCWDTLPIDVPDARSGALVAEGYVDLSTLGKHVSISGYGGAASDPHNIAWPSPYDVVNDDAIVFDWRGTIVNPASNYTADGHVYIDIANKFRARTEHVLECYVIRVGINGAQSGLVAVTRQDAACPLSVLP